MRRTAMALRLGHIATQALISQPFSPTQRSPRTADIGDPDSTRTTITHLKGGTQ